MGCGSDDALEELKIPSSIPTLISENAGISGVGLKRTANSLRGQVCARMSDVRDWDTSSYKLPFARK